LKWKQERESENKKERESFVLRRFSQNLSSVLFMRGGMAKPPGKGG